MPVPTPYFNFNELVAKLHDNRLIAKGINIQKVASPGGCIAILVRVPDLRYIEQVLDVEFHLDGFDCSTNYVIGPEMNKKIVGNLVGMSLYVVSTGQSLTTSVIAIGPP